jgi:acetolactate synthase-1/2/3 large subunit
MKIDQGGLTNSMQSSANCNTEVSQVADLIVNYLQQIGVEYVFGVPGGAIEPFYNALARKQRQGGNIKPVFVCHEATAAFMADGYSRYSGKLGVCVATSGPGASNLITGIACAYENHIPLLVITGQPPLPNFGKGALQESSGIGVDMVSMMHHCTRYNSLISHVSQIESKLVAAIMCAMHATKGPVHLSIPVDIHRQDVSNSAPQYDLAQLLHQRRSFFDQVTVKQLTFELERATQPLFMIGEGAHGGIEAVMNWLC